MIERELKEITEADLLKLITDPVREGRTIEYKVELNLKSDDAKRKFLASIASFANAAGGDFVLGMKTDGTDKALPVALQPLANFNPDADVLMLQEIIRRHIEPKVFTVDFQPVSINGGHVLVIRIRKTWAGAHMVTYNDDCRFYTRSQGGRSLMNVPEIRSAFTLAETTREKINRFRLERLSNIFAGEAPVTLNEGGIIALHLCPLRSFDPAYLADLEAVSRKPWEFPTMYVRSTNAGYDFDGFLSAHRPEGVSSGYSFAFRNGCLESVDAGIITVRNDKPIINGELFDTHLVEHTAALFKVLRMIGAEPPVVLMLSLANVKGYTIWAGQFVDYDHTRPIKRDQLLLPAILVESIEMDTGTSATLLKPLLDSVWNACGFPRSLNYNSKGEWAPSR